MEKNNKKTLNFITVATVFLFTVFNVVAFAVIPVASGSTGSAVQNMTKETSVSAAADIVVLNNEPLLFSELDYVVSYNMTFYDNLLFDLQNAVNQLKVAVASDDYTCEAFEAMRDELNRLESIMVRVKSNQARMSIWESDYYYATKTWNFLIEQGYNEAVVSGIIGNMMIETAGGTLYLKPFIYNPSNDYYGLCQWSLYYRPEVADMTFENQLEYLASDIEKEFNTFGNCYKNGFTYEDFKAITSPEEAARAFAIVYERCGSSYYDIRVDAAVTAYNYFSLV